MPGSTATVTNTSTTTANGVTATLRVGDGSGPVTYDLPAILASGTKGCSVGGGALVCSIGKLAAGASASVTVLAETSGLSPGTTLSGTGQVTASNATTATTDLGPVTVVSVPDGIITVAPPGIAVTSSTAPLSTSLADVTLKLPKTKIAATSGGLHRATKQSGLAPPPVAVTLEALPAAQVPALCPPAPAHCSGTAIEVIGNFASYTNQAHPISAVIQVYYGATVPTGNIYMLKSSGRVVELQKCAKVGGLESTPCVDGKEKVIGTAGHLATQDTVYFTGTDPGFQRR